jgi:pimeloyl-ACP methyl ester carboxylesterase
MASAPPQGIGRATVRAVKQHPWLALKSTFTGDTMGRLNTPNRARESMFSPTTPESLVVDYTSRFQQESKRALYIDAMFHGLPNPECVTAPLLVLGGEQDGGFTPAEVRATAEAYRTEAELFPDMGHDMMLEPGWRDVAERIHAWLSSRGL